MFVQVTAKNVGGVFLRHSVYFTHALWDVNHWQRHALIANCWLRPKLQVSERNAITTKETPHSQELLNNT